MGEKGNRRFGTYLRQIREDRSLTLDQIEESALAYRVQISKAYLSRCENGITKPNLERLSVLSKIYSTDLGLLIERHETEKELEQTPPIDLTGLSFDEIHAAGKEQVLHGQLKAAFMTFSAAHDLAVLEGGESAAVRRAEARLALSYVLSEMERYELACQEAGEVMRMKEIPELSVNRALIQIATCHYRLRRLHLAQMLIEGLERRVDSLPEKQVADVFHLSAVLATEFGRHRDAIQKARKAASLYRSRRYHPGEARSLEIAGASYLSLGELERAVDYCERGLKIARRYEYRRLQAELACTLARAYARAGSRTKARAVLHEAMEIARAGDYKGVLLSCYLQLLKVAIEEEDMLTKASMLRSLRRLSTRVPVDDPGVMEFRAMEREGLCG